MSNEIIRKKIDFICQGMVKKFPLEKIYIDNENNTHLKYIRCIPENLIENNLYYINNNHKELKAIVELKKKYKINYLYIEMDFNVVKYVEAFNDYEINEAEFDFIKKSLFIRNVLERKKKILSSDVIINELVSFISLFEPKKAINIIQYMVFNNVFDYIISKGVFDNYIKTLDQDDNFCKVNNFRYLRNAALTPFSLKQLEIDMII
ncbi:hypothetical protein [Pectobacterium carotovorum]|uniref:hypothetical protein n=2 Tax=Pectobacterium carotovorum TaxID=554 RepID=UPI0030162D1E